MTSAHSNHPVHEVVLYSSPGCHLCEQAADALRSLQRGRPFHWTEVDIHSDLELEKLYLLEIPVIEVDGVVVTQAPIEINKVRFALEA